MPKQPAGITKHKRISVLVDILRRWGKIDKVQIDTHVATSLGCDTEDISRALYRDLEELIDTNEVVTEYYTRDNVLIENFDPSIHKNFTKKWSVIGGENKIIGQSLIEKSGGFLYCPKFLKNDVAIEDGRASVSLQNKHLFFTIKNHFLCMKIALSAYPVKILVTRSMKSSFKADFINEMEQKHGIRVIVLAVPVANVSGVSKDQLGHFLIEVLDENRVKISDLNSLNGTYIYKLTMNDADELRMKGNLLGDETVTYSWNSLSKESFNRVEVKANKPLEISSSCVIQASERFRILVV